MRWEEIHYQDGSIRVQLTHPPIPDEEMEERKGEYLTEEDVDLVIGQPGTPYGKGEVSVFKPNGELLVKYIPGVLGSEACEQAWGVLRTVGGEASNRGTAAGIKMKQQKNADGSLSRTLRAWGSTRDSVPYRHRGVGSGIIGAFERSSPRFPMCRLTAFNLHHPERFEAAIPFIQDVDRVFLEHLPERHAAQMARVHETHPAWRIHGTAFSTITVNKDFRTAIHKDKGDLKEGFGVMTVLRAGVYTGCHTVFPAFRVGVDMHTRGVCLADVHEFHGNTTLVGKPRRYERIACVLYYRTKMRHCKSPEEEVAYAASRGPGDPIWPDEREDFDPSETYVKEPE